MNDSYISTPIDLTWRLACRVACQALIHSTSFDVMLRDMVTSRIQQRDLGVYAKTRRKP